MSTILVTGSHRSGTGWVGQVLAASPWPVGYVWEPFSVLHRPGTCTARFDHWFPYVCEENEHDVLGPMRDTLSWHYSISAEVRAIRSPKDVARMVRDKARYERYRQMGAVPLLKDPIAVFSVEWLHERFDAEPVLLVRHPAAFAASIKRLKLRHPFGDFLAQPLLMRDWLEPFHREIERFAKHEQDLVDQAILLWNVIHHALITYRQRHDDWIMVRLEDLARHPKTLFKVLFAYLSLPVDDHVLQMIVDTSSAQNPAEATTMDSIQRDSAAHIWNWKRTLSREEQLRVRRGTLDVAGPLYREEDW